MEAITVSKRSWHYRLLRAVNGGWYEQDDDICGYLKSLTGALLCVFLISAFAGLVTGIVGDFLAWLAVCIVLQTLAPLGVGPVCMIFLGCIAAILGSIYWVVEADKSNVPVPSFAKHAYRSLKDRVCYRLEYK